MSSDSYRSSNEHHKVYIETESIKEQKLKHSTSSSAVIRALVANLGIAGIKLFCFLLTRSSAMLSEAIHSGLDSFNSICLLVGLKRGAKPADKFHPFGYGLEANIWALFACILMLLGTFVSVYSGVDKLIHNHHEIQELLDNYYLIALTLGGSILFESWAVYGASKAVLEEVNVEVKNKFKIYFKSFGYITKIKSPTTKFVWYEDSAALLGVTVAFIALTISKYAIAENYAYIPDAIASIIIGIILFALAIYLLKNNINSLTGVAAGPQTEKMIKEIAMNIKGVSDVMEIKTIDMGSSGLIINMQIEVDPQTQVKDADDIADRVEKKIKKRIKRISHITIEIQADDEQDNWNKKFDDIVQEGKKLDVLNKAEAQMLNKFVDFTQTVVEEIMVPRTEVVFVDANASIEQMVDLIIDSGHTRIPIYQDNIDNIIGVINSKDVLKAVKEEGFNGQKLENMARDLHIIPENKPISDLLNEFTSNKIQMAVVVDEHGGVSGIVTVEDILEEIVGEIYDEFDVIQTAEVIKIDEQTINVCAKTDISYLNERFDLDIPDEDFQTIGGFVFGKLGREPEVSDEVIEGKLTFVVKSVDGHKITRIRISKIDVFNDTHEEKDEQEE